MGKFNSKFLGSTTSIDMKVANFEAILEEENESIDTYENNLKFWRVFEEEEIIVESFTIENFTKFDPEESYIILHLEKEILHKLSIIENNNEKTSLKELTTSFTEDLVQKDLESCNNFFKKFSIYHSRRFFNR
jgi:hypothetical protein